MDNKSEITLSERDVMKGWYILAVSSLQDAVRESNSAPTRAAAAFEAGYFSALQSLVHSPRATMSILGFRCSRMRGRNWISRRASWSLP